MTGYQYSRYAATKYLFCDIERRHNHDQVWTNCSVAVCAMDSKQNLISNSTEYILESALECEKFIKNLVNNEKGQYTSFPSLYMDLRKDEELLESFCLMYFANDSNIDISNKDKEIVIKLLTVVAGKITGSGDVATELGPETDESYSIAVTTDPPTATVTAATAFGLRHGLETLGQLVVTPQGTIQAPITISDRPQYAYRGLMIDTGRHFLSVETIKRAIDGMATMKL